MRRFVKWIEQPRIQVRWWVFWTLAWLVLNPITMATGLRHSVPWLNEESLFANFASCGTAAVAALAYVRAASADRKADHIVEHHPDIPPLSERKEPV